MAAYSRVKEAGQGEEDTTDDILGDEGPGNEDTLALARQERETQGSWEVELSFRGEADLHRHLSECTKNPGHHKFIPVYQLTRDHLPYHFQYAGLFRYIKTLSDVTVRVSVKFISDNRPKVCPRSGIPFPCYTGCHRRDALRYGTGFLSWVDIFTDQTKLRGICPCKECCKSANPRTQFASIKITTASHVVYDDLEGEHTTCHLFFDKGGRPTPRTGCVTLVGMSKVKPSVEMDSCDMTHMTHDLDLANRLQKMLNEHWRSQDKLLELQVPQLPDKEKEQPLTVIVSHPHGCSKQVSIGHCINRAVEEKTAFRYIYNTATCPGSSGALVTVLEGENSSLGTDHLHSGNVEGSTELNHSGYEVFWGKKTVATIKGKKLQAK